MVNRSRLWILSLSIAALLSPDALANRTQHIADVPVAVTVIDSCELTPDLVNVAELLTTTPLPSSVGGCMVSFPAGRADDALTIRGITAIEDRRLQSVEILSVELNAIPGCYSAQDNPEQTADGEDRQRSFGDRWAAFAGSADVADNAGVLARTPAPITPEAFIEGTVLGWGREAEKPPVYYRVHGGGELELVVDGGDITITDDVETWIVTLGEDGEEAEIVIVEELDECTTQTTVVRGSGGAGTSAPAGGVGIPAGEEIVIVPGVPPPAFPPEEDEEREEAGFCSVANGELQMPVTREYLELEDPYEPDVSRHSPAIGGFNAQVANGRMIQTTSDLHVQALGPDFELQRTYAGHMQTQLGGSLAHRWQLSYDRRITITADLEEREGLKVEPLMAQTQLSYANGFGRLDVYPQASKELHDVLNFGVVRPFKAHITTFESPPGAMHEIQRYAVVRAGLESGLVSAPENHPFKSHPNVDDINGESIFYVLRTPEHEQYVFNCRGQNIVIIDRFNHRVELTYSDEISPLTHNPMLAKIRDANQREYEFKIAFSEECAPYQTWYKGQQIADPCARVPMFSRVEDPWGRTVRYRQNDESQLRRVVRQFGSEELVSGYGYGSSGGANHLLLRAFEPASGPLKPPYLSNLYTDGRLTTQLLGGSRYQLSYPEDTITEVTNPNGTVIRYELNKLNSGTVAKAVIRTAGSSEQRTEFEHNDAGQVVKAVLPRGNRVEYEYFRRGDPVRIAEAPMQNLLDMGITYRNPLNEGLLKAVRQVSHLPEDLDQELVESYDYEPLYNQLKWFSDASGYETSHSFRYDVVGAYGRPIHTHLPDRSSADGSTLTDLKIHFSYDQHGHTISETNPRGDATRFAVGPLGELNQVNAPEGVVRLMKHDDRGNLIEHVDARGLKEVFEVNLRDLVTARVVDPDGINLRTDYQYDLNGNRTDSRGSIVDVFAKQCGIDTPESRTVRISTTYDVLNRVTFEHHQVGAMQTTRTHEYDANGNVEKTEKRQGNVVTLSTYDGFDRLKRVSSAGVMREFFYDGNGNLRVEVDSLGHRTNFEYDGFDRKIAMVDPLRTRYEFKLDTNGNLIEQKTIGSTGRGPGDRATLQHTWMVIDQHNLTVEMRQAVLDGQSDDRVSRFSYDRAGDLIEEQLTDGSVRRLTRDRLGRPTSVIDPLGNELRYAYEPGGEITSLVELEKDQVYGPSQGWSDVDRQTTTSFTYDVFGNQTEFSQGIARTTQAFDSLGNTRCLSDERGQQVLRYDGMDRLTETFSAAGKTSYTYNDRGMLETMTGPAGVEERDYDPAGRLTRYSLNGAERTMTYDAVGNPTLITDARGVEIKQTFGPTGLLRTASGGQTDDEFRHDGLGRVVVATAGPGELSRVERRFNGVGELISEAQSLLGDTHVVAAPARSASGETLKFPAVAGGLLVDYKRDPLGRVIEINPSEHFGAVEYRYSGVDRQAGRSLGGLVSAVGYDDDRRAVRLNVYAADQADNRTYEAQRFYDGSKLRQSVSRVYPRFANQDPNQRSDSKYTYDGAGRLTVTESVHAHRRDLSSPWLHQFVRRESRFDSDDKLASVVSSNASIASEFLQLGADVKRVSEARRDRFTRDEKGRIGNTSTVVLKPDLEIPMASAGLDGAEVDALMAQASSYPGFADDDQPFEYDANGNLISDEHYLYDYDIRNRLTRVTDRLAAQWGRRQILSVRYDAFGRPVMQEFETQNIDRAAFQRMDVRYLYWDQAQIAELGREPWNSQVWKLIARYVPGASPGELIGMERRIDDELDNAFMVYLFYEGLSGELSFVARPYGAPSKVLQTPLFSGQDPWTQGAREEPVVAGTNTRVPYRARGLRYDSFLRNTVELAGHETSYNYRGAPFLEHERYSTENFRALLEQIEKHHPRPELLVWIDRVAAVAFTGGFGLAASAGLAPVAMMSQPLWMGGAIGAGADTAITMMTGNEVTSRNVALSFAVGALTGGIGHLANAFVIPVRATLATRMGATAAMDIAVGTSLDVLIKGSKLSDAIASNTVGAAIGGVLSAGASSVSLGAHTPARVHSGDTSLARLMPAIREIEYLATVDMPVANVFLDELRKGKLSFTKPVPSAWSLERRLGYHHTLSRAYNKLVIAAESVVPYLGLHSSRSQIGGLKSRVLEIKTGVSPQYTATTLLHEFAHSRGANELQAFHITYAGLYHLSNRVPGGAAPTTGILARANSYMAIMQAPHNRASRWRAALDLKKHIARSYIRQGIWKAGDPMIAIKTNPSGWVSELGTPPWRR